MSARKIVERWNALFTGKGAHRSTRKGGIYGLVAFVTSIATLLACVVVGTAQADTTWIVDPSTQNSWYDDPQHGVAAGNGDDYSSENTGRVWTDKTVYAGNAELTDVYGHGTLTVENNQPDTALVGLSALSSTSTIQGTEQSREPLDIVLVVDTSVSMREYMNDYTYTAEYNVDLGQTYYVENAKGTHDAVKYDAESGSWKTENGALVVPATSESAGDENAVTFYSRTVQNISKVDGLKKAVLKFIDQTMAENEGVPASRQSHISIVKMGGRLADGTNVPLVGWDTYGDQQKDTENYTQIVTQMTDDGTQLTNDINKLFDPGDDGNYPYVGGQSSDLPNGVQMAGTALSAEQGGRADAQKVVVFFGATAPTSNGYNASLSGNVIVRNAINKAKDLKDEGVIIYSVGAYLAAEPDEFTRLGNQGYNGVCSKYPNAQASTEVVGDGFVLHIDPGEPAEGDYMFPANDMETLQQVFDYIQSDISESAKSPITSSTGTGPGAITFTDKLGDYMEVKDFASIVYAGQQYTQSSKATNEDGSTTYTFTGTINDPNKVYNSGDLSEIEIKVQPGSSLQEGDTVTVTIPDKLLPMRCYNVTVKDGKVDASSTPAYPIRVFYNVGLKAQAQGALDDPEHSYLSEADGTALKNYLDANGNTFYSNSFDKGASNGKTTATFAPATDNSFYYFTEDTPLLTEKDPNKVATTISENGTYYYRYRYFATGKTEWQYRYIEVPGNSDLLSDQDNLTQNSSGEWLVKAGTPHYVRTDEFSAEKTDNTTKTAENSISPSWNVEDREKTVTDYLGNNGKFTPGKPGRIKLSKTVTWNDYTGSKDQKFTFTVDFNGDNDLAGEYVYKVYATNGDQPVEGAGGTVIDGGQIQLADGQYAVIYGLPGGTSYSITETDLPEGFTSNQTGNKVSGTVVAEETQTAAFTNTYGDTPTELAIPVSKILNRAWNDKDTYTFNLAADQSDPDTKAALEAGNIVLPNDATVTLTKASADVADAENTKTGTFGNITFKKAGTYQFVITEQIPGDATNPDVNNGGTTYADASSDEKKQSGWQLDGVTYDGTTKSVTVNVTPSDGELHASLSGGQTTASFNNTFTYEGKTSADLKGTKTMVGRNFKAGDTFTFQVSGSCDNPQVTSVPLPAKVTDQGTLTINPTSGESAELDFGKITFNLPGIYTYTFSEVQPEGSDKLPGVQYDTTEVTVKVKVWDDNGELKTQHFVGDNQVSPGNVSDSLKWTNTYTPASTTANIGGTKTLVGRDSLDGENFTFTLAPADDDTTTAVSNGDVLLNSDKASTLTTSVTGLKDNVASAFSFNGIMFKKAGTYKFKITETAGTAAHMDYDDRAAEVTVEVTDDGNGQLTATVTPGTGDKAPDFKNTYTAEIDKEFTLSGTKKVDVASGDFEMENGQFTFLMTPQNGAPLPTGNGLTPVDLNGDAKNDAVQVTSGSPTGDSATYRFKGKITFTEAGTYTYLVTEQAGDDAGITYDGTQYEVTFKVTKDSKTGELKVAGPTVVKHGASDTVDNDKLDFTNTFEVGKVSGTQTITKHLTGRTMTSDDEFTFDISATAVDTKGESVAFSDMAKPENTAVTGTADGYTYSVTMTGDEGKNEASIQLPTVTYAKPGTYTYTISERAGSISGVTYDGASYVVVVTISQTDGKLSRSSVIHKSTADGETVESVTFTNTYKTTGDLDGNTYLKVSKSISGRPWNEGETYTFKIEAMSNTAGVAVKDMPMPRNSELTFGGNGGTTDPASSAFGDITYTKPGTYTYTISEQGTNGNGIVISSASYTVQVTAEDNGDGTMTVTSTMSRTTNDSGSAVNENVGDNVASFTNTYTTSTTTSGDISVSKTLTGRPWEDGDSFGFTLSADPDDQTTVDAVAAKTVVLPANASSLTIANDSTGTDGVRTASFGGITFTAAGTFKFVVQETDPGEGNRVPGVTYDDAVKHVTFEVKDDGQGNLTAVKSESSDDLSFDNRYTVSPGDLALTVRKTIPSAEWTADGYTGRPWNEGETYTFTLAEGAGNDKSGYTMPSDSTTTVSAPGSGVSNTASFGNITFTKAGTYTFTITETPGAAEGMAYDQHTATVTVNVSDVVNGKHTGVLVATATYANDNAPSASDRLETGTAAFTNVYTPRAGVYSLPVTKNLGRAWQEGDTFTFMLSLDATKSSTDQATDPASAVTLPANASGLDISGTPGTTSPASGSFGDITFKMPGTYVFNVTEKIPNEATSQLVGGGKVEYQHASDEQKKLGGWQYKGITYDTATRQVTIKVTDDHNGNLIAQADGGVNLEFTNNYGATGTLPGATDLVVRKALGREWVDGDSFTFTIAGVSSTVDQYLPLPSSSSVTIAKDSADVSGATNTKEAHFGDITYTKAGTYTYRITEDVNVADEDPDTPGTQHNGITYSQAEYQVVVTVEDPGTGTLAVESTMQQVKNQSGADEQKEVENALFTNEYDAEGTLNGSTDLKVSKTLNGRDWNENDKFTVTLAAQDADQPMPAGSSDGKVTIDLTKPENGATASAHFGDITYTEPGTYTYTITEQGTDGNGLTFSKAQYEVTVTVTDQNHNGTLTVESEMKMVKNNAGDDADNTVSDKTAAFTNDYKTKSATIQVPVTKVIENRKFQKGDSFEFTIEASGDTKAAVEDGIVRMPADKTATIGWADGDDTFTKDGQFGAITFTKAGDYTFEVREAKGSIGGMTYDDTVKTVTVHVTDNGKGNLSAALAENSDDTTFTNVSQPEKDVDKGDVVKPSISSDGQYVSVGDHLTYSIDWTNTALDENGDPADGTVTITDKVPDGTKLVDGTISDGGVASDGTITWTIAATAGQSGTVSFTVAVTADAYGLDANTVDNTATVKLGDDPAVETNTTENPVPEKDVDKGDDVEPSISSDGQYVSVGDHLTYSIDWTNTALDENGDPADGTVTITDKVPDGTKLVDGTISDGGVASDGTITWTIAATAGQSGTVSFTVEVLPAALDLPGQKVSNKATVKLGDDPAVETNTTENPVPGKGQAVVPVTKVIENRKFQKGDSFEFTIEASGDTKAAVEDGIVRMPADKTATIGWADGDDTFTKDGQFGAITFTKAGDYTFEVREAKGSIGGMTYDDTVKTVTVHVTDDGNGTLTATIPAGTDTTFTNVYKPEGSVTITDFGLTKAFTGTTWDTEQFTFNISGSDGAPMPKDADGNDVTSVTVGADALNGDGVAPIDFGTITYDKVGTYTYTVTEANGGQTIGGIHYDGHAVVITVSVTDNLHGGFTASVTNVTGEKQFTNEYGTELNVENPIQIIKNLSGHDIADDQFEFTVTAKDDASAKKAGFKHGEMSQIVKVNDSTMDANGIASVTMPILSGMHFTDAEHDAVYTYTVKETKGGGAGYTNDTREQTITITVNDDGAGTLTTTTVVDDGQGNQTTYVNNNQGQTNPATVTFTNTYDATGSATIKATKQLENGQLSGNDFRFQVVNDYNGNVVSTGTNDAAGTVSFGAINYDIDQLISDYTAGNPAVDYDDATDTYTYHYTVSEVQPLPDGVSAQDASFKVDVELKDNGDGTLGVNVVYPDGTPDSGLAFRNSYGDNAKATVNVSGAKMLEKSDPSLNPPDITGKFKFTLTGVDESGNPAPLPGDATGSVEATNDGTGTVEFGDIVYTMANTFGTTTSTGTDGADLLIAQRTKTFTYTVTESGSVAGVTNDAQASRTFTVTVTDNGDGTLDAVCSETPGDQFTFTNVYSVQPVRSTPDISITKHLTGREIQDGEFGFQMSGVSAPDDIDPSASVLTASNVGTNVNFGDITFTKPGDYVYAISEMPGDRGGVTYDDAVYFATATVTDNQDGTLSVAWTYTDADGAAISKDDGIAFENTYKAASVPVTLGATKVLDGRELKDGEFTFELTDGKDGDGNQAPMPGETQETTVTATNAADGSITFDPITFDKAGTYTYTMREVAGDEEGMTYDDTQYSIVVTVTDDGEGKLVASTAMLNGTNEVDGIVFSNTYEAPKEPGKPGEGEGMAATGSDLAPIMALTVLLLLGAGVMATLKRRD